MTSHSSSASLRPLRALGLAVAGSTALLAASCGGGGGGSGGSNAQVTVVEIAHGFGLLVPHSVFVPNASGFPTQQLVTIQNTQDLIDNVRLTNPVLPPATWPVNPVLPNGLGGNHFIYARLSQPIDVDSVLDPSPSGQANSGLTGTITVVGIDPVSGSSIPVKGRAFIGGQTYSGAATGSPPQLQLQPWVTAGLGGVPIANPAVDNDNDGIPDGLGFPGTQDNTSFQGENVLALPQTFVFVADTDGDLTTHETFPAGLQIKLKATRAVTGAGGIALRNQAVASTTVGPDVIPPRGKVNSPIDGAQSVDPLTTVELEFTEPVQPLSVGPLPTGAPPQLSSAVTVSFGPPAASVTVPFSAQPISAFDLSTYRLTMAFNFPGSGPNQFQCGTFNRVQVDLNADQTQDMVLNLNTATVQSEFFTGEGPGLVNAPVVPDAIYVTRGGATPGISVVDLNGFGQSTGNPTFNPSQPIEGNTNFPNNPNVLLQGSLIRPPLQVGSCTIDGGSAGVFTLTTDSNLDTLLVKPPLITSIGEMMIGQPLDTTFNNGQDPTGCQSGGGNLCAILGKKVVAVVQNTLDTTRPPTPFEVPLQVDPGAPNTPSWAPHPNPPPLVFPPLCLSPFIGGQEVTSIETICPPPPQTPFPNCLGLTNLLVPGDPFGNPSLGVPPSGLLTDGQNNFMLGPGVPGQQLALCNDYMIRQQIGHFLYMIDRARQELVVLNSNRMTVVDRIALPDPTSLAMSPNVDFLAVTNQNADTVSFVNIDPQSASFHTVVTNTVVGRGPRGIAWQPNGEDVLVCNEQESTVSIISGFSFAVRKVVSSQLNQPFEVAVLARQNALGFFRNVYFAWIINRDGRVALFESGPDGVNGWGFDDIIGSAPFTFRNPKTIRPDLLNLNGACWIVHEDDQGNGRVSNLVIDSTTLGQLTLGSGIGNPQLRDLTFDVRAEVDSSQLTGIPVDIAFDNLTNLSVYTNNWNQSFSPGTPVPVIGKSSAKIVTGTPLPTNSPSFMLLSVPNSSEGPGVLDVIDINNGLQRFDTNPFVAGTQSIRVPGATQLSDYFKQ